MSERIDYVLWGEPAAGDDRYRDLLVDEVAPRLLEAGAGELVVAVDDAASHCPSLVPTPDGEQPHVAVVSASVPCHDRAGELDAAVAATGLRWASYLVSSALYTDYGDNRWSGPRTWPAGERSPSVLTVCLIHRRADLEHREFLRRWHGRQSPLSADIQPRQRYVRDEVIRPLSDAAPPVDGIVSEAWASAEVISDPMQFFLGEGDAARMNDHIAQMIDSVSSSMDLDRLRNVTMSEYLFSPP